MGTCQGRFCQPRVIAIIAREMHVPESQIPGLEPGSSLLPHRRVTEEDRQYLKWLDSDGGGNGAAAKAKM